MSGNSVNNPRIAGSNSSTLDPAWPRTYFGATSDANPDRTVFRASPNRRAIAFTPIPSDMCNRRTSAHCSTLITSSLW